MITALGAATIRPALFVEATFTNETIHVWNGLGSITWNGKTWMGVGSLGSVSSIEEGSAVEAKGVSITMSGLDPVLLTDVLEQYQVGLPVSVWLGLFDDIGALIPDPILSFAGRMDQPTLTVDGKTASISINCESKLLDMNVACEFFYTNEQQQLDYPLDKGLSFVSSIQEVQIYWGKAPSAQNNK